MQPYTFLRARRKCLQSLTVEAVAHTKYHLSEGGTTEERKLEYHVPSLYSGTAMDSNRHINKEYPQQKNRTGTISRNND